MSPPCLADRVPRTGSDRSRVRIAQLRRIGQTLLAPLLALRFNRRVSEQHDLALVNGCAVLPGGLVERVNIGVRDGKIVTLASSSLDAEETLDVGGLTI